MTGFLFRRQQQVVESDESLDQLLARREAVRARQAEIFTPTSARPEKSIIQPIIVSKPVPSATEPTPEATDMC